MPRPAQTSAVRAPWFRHHRAVALVVVSVLYAAVLALRLSLGTVADAYSMLYVLPVALTAMSFGRRGGVIGGVVAVALIAVWVAVRDIDLTVSGWLTRVLPLLFLGALLGDASDRLDRAEAERRRLEAAALLHREAIEINDSLIQGMAAAKWSLESGQIDLGLRTLTDTIEQAQELVSGLIRRADMGHHATVTTRVSTPS